MNKHDLTREQAQRMQDDLAPALGYLSKLKRRIDEERFPDDDSLRRNLTTAQAAMQDLVMQLHYMTCQNVGEKRG